jgi:hypothetical protein
MLASVPDIRRDLVKESLEIYPIKDYGAIEIGVHRFCHKEHGQEECGSFKFVMSGAKSVTRGKFHASSVMATRHSSKKLNQRVGRFLGRRF